MAWCWNFGRRYPSDCLLLRFASPESWKSAIRLAGSAHTLRRGGFGVVSFPSLGTSAIGSCNGCFEIRRGWSKKGIGVLWKLCKVWSASWKKINHAFARQPEPVGMVVELLPCLSHCNGLPCNGSGKHGRTPSAWISRLIADSVLVRPISSVHLTFLFLLRVLLPSRSKAKSLPLTRILMLLD